MSIFRSLFPFYDLISKLNNDRSAKIAGYTIAGFGTSLHAMYAFGTVEVKSITIKDKYQMYSNNITRFYIIDTQNNHYCIPYSVWYFQYNVPEIWSSIEKSKPYKIKYYGYRIPCLNLFPNIIKA